MRALRSGVLAQSWKDLGGEGQRLAGQGLQTLPFECGLRGLQAKLGANGERQGATLTRHDPLLARQGVGLQNLGLILDC